MASLPHIAPDSEPGAFVRIDDLDRLLNRTRGAQYWAIGWALLAVMALQIAGPYGVAGGSILPGPAWIYPILAIGCLAIAIAVRLRAERELLAMEISSLKLRGMRDAAARAAATDVSRDQNVNSG